MVNKETHIDDYDFLLQGTGIRVQGIEALARALISNENLLSLEILSI